MIPFLKKIVIVGTCFVALSVGGGMTLLVDHLRGPVFVKNVYFEDFRNWKTTFYSNPTKDISNWDEERISLVETAGKNALHVSGSQRFVARDYIKISSDKLYKVTVRVRALSEDMDAQGQFYAGLAGYNAKKKPLFSCCYKYPAASGALKVRYGWQIKSGLISGNTKTKHKFRKRTRYVRPVLLVNYRSPDMVTEIDYFRVDEVKPR